MTERAAELLRNGSLVAFPTETVYGLGANALDADAVARIFEAKQRPSFDPLIVHIASLDDLPTVASRVPEMAEKLAAAFWPGPLTLVLPKSDAIPPIVTSGLATVAVRMPSHPIAHRLIADAGVPIAAPSANRFGELSPTHAEHVRESFGDEVSLIIDGGATEWGVESTIVDVTGNLPVVLRYGATTVEQIESVVGEVREQLDNDETPNAPGQLKSHYAPRKRMHIVEPGFETAMVTASYLSFSNIPVGSFVEIEVLSPTSDLREAAANLFDALHRLDSGLGEVIYAELVPETGLGRAINDRLRRATA